MQNCFTHTYHVIIEKLRLHDSVSLPSLHFYFSMTERLALMVVWTVFGRAWLTVICTVDYSQNQITFCRLKGKYSLLLTFLKTFK